MKNMKKFAITVKKIGLTVGSTIAALSIALAGNAFADTTPDGKPIGGGFVVETRGGIAVYNPCDDGFWFRLGGRLEFDEVVFSGDFRDRQGNFPSSGNIRRAFLSFRGGLGDCFSANLTLDFGRSFTLYTFDNTNRFGLPTPLRTRPATPLSNIPGIVLIEEAWLGYSGLDLFDCTMVRFGQFTPLATIDAASNYGITNAQMFLESALATRAFDVPSYIQTDSRAMKGFGLIVNTEICDLFTVGLTGYQPAHGPLNVYGDPRRSDRWGWAGRITFSPIHECDTALHLGFLARYQALNHTDASNTLFPNNGSTSGPGNPPADAILNTLFFTTPEVTPRNYVGNPANYSVFTVPFGTAPNNSATYDPNLVNTGAIRAKSYNHLAAEFAAIWCQWTLLGEYHYTNVQRKPFSANIIQEGNVDFHGWHAQLGYVLTGESRGYDFKYGALRSIHPCNCYGAWEIAARYSYINLNDKDVFGGSEHNVTLGLNWYVNDNVRFAFNYLRANINPTGIVAGQQPPFGTPKRKLDILAGRVQLVF